MIVHSTATLAGRRLMIVIAGCGFLNANVSIAGESATDQPSRSGDVKTSEQIIAELIGTRGFGVQARADLDVKFEYNSARLTDQARRQLHELGVALESRELKGQRYELAGHTDSVGSDAFNQRLSEARAATAYSYLVTVLKLDANRFVATGYGESRPINTKDKTASENRRVEVIEVGEYRP